MPIHIHPLVMQLRFYAEGVDVSKPLCEMTDTYQGVANITIDDDGTARVSLMRHADFTKAEFNAVKRCLKQQGAKRMHYKHKEKLHDFRLD